MINIIQSLIDSACKKINCFLGQFIGNIFPIEKKKVFLSNFAGAGFGCNPKYIALALHEIDPSLRFVWQVKEYSDDFPKWIIQVKIGTTRSFWELSTSKIWIDNWRKSQNIKKRSGQFYIQTWHGYNGPKKAEGDSIEALTPDYIKQAKYDSSITDLYISNGKFFSDTLRRAFWYNGEIFESGIPRCDGLFQKNKPSTIRSLYNIDNDKLIVLYAPTFRKDKGNVYDIDFDRLRKTLKHKFHKESVVLLRLHPNMRYMDLGFEYDNNLINASLHPDMYELMAETEIFITDYSSSLFEFACTMKPTFIYASDISDYANDRGFHFDMTKLPFPVSQNNDEFEQNILAYDEQILNGNVLEFMKTIGINKETGKASSKVAERIIVESLK